MTEATFNALNILIFARFLRKQKCMYDRMKNIYAQISQAFIVLAKPAINRY